MTGLVGNGLADQPARQRIAESHGETLFVEAGAGSGKTSSLVSRMVTLVLSGADVTSIAAITFTEAAAAELRARVRQTLEHVEAGRAVRHVVDSADARRRAGEALDRLDRATVCTLHAFAQRLLLGAPVEAALPPTLQVHDDISSTLRFEDRWQRFERALLDDESLATVMRTALTLGIGSRDLQVVAATLGQNWDLVEEAALEGRIAADRAVEVDITDLDVDRWIADWEYVCTLAEKCTDPDDKLRSWVDDEAAPLLSRLRASRQQPYVLLDVARTELPSPGNKGKKGNWPDGCKDELVAAAKQCMTDMADDVARLTDHVLTRLAAEIAQYTLDDAEARRVEGRLEFHDLLVLARRVLRNRHDVRRRFHDRYAHLLIDEFQDTDPLQVELAIRIAADPSHDTSTPWHEVDVAPGRLFFVGDPKQSIYRFRRADIDLFSRAARRYADGHISLNVNFRTVEPVLRFCNAIFERMIQPAEEELDDGRTRIAQPEYVPLATSRPALAGDPGPPVLVLGDGTAHDSAEDGREAEAADVAAILRRAHLEGWLVSPEDRPRPCRWSDMAVLLPSRTTLSHLRSHLDDAEIPYRLESGTLVFGTTEITDLLSILRAIDDPGDAISVVGALRSPAYGCGDDDLHRWVQDHGRCTYLGAAVRSPEELAPGETRGPVEAALADLRARHRDSPFRSVPEIVEGVVRERRLMESSLAGGRHRDVWRLYRVVIEHARQFADTKTGGLRSFLHWAELQRDDKVRATSPVIPEADVDAVRILTIHGSKGLEFGITVVSGLSAQDPNSVRGATVQFRPTGGFDVRMRKGMETARFESVRTLEETMDLHERIRLLYVALTRARDHLVVSSHHTSRARGRSHGGRLAAQLLDREDELAAGLAERWTAPAPSETVDQQVIPFEPLPGVDPSLDLPSDHEVERWGDELDEWKRARSAVHRRAAGGGVVSATSIAAALTTGQDRRRDVDAEVVPEREPWRRGRAGTSVGSAVHAVLQHADLADPLGADVAGLASWQAKAEGIAGSAAMIEHKARLALRSPLVRRAVESKTWRREVHVATPLPEFADGSGSVDLFEGFVDLLFDDGDGWVVVDYKTDDVSSDADIARALERYSPQGAAYAIALEAVTDRPVREVHFLFLRGGEAVDVPVPDLAGVVRSVRDTLSEL